jgi:N-methylhydantoinase B
VAVNDGCFRPLRIVCPPRTIFSAERPAPVSTYWETLNYVTDLIWKALAPIAPDRLPAGHFLSVCGSVVAGQHPDTGDLFLLVEPHAGGWGGATVKDGEQGLMCVADGETFMVPIEVLETRYGVLVDRYALDTEPFGGTGMHRGGRGCVRAYRAVADEIFVTATCGRHKFVPWGVDGGSDGSRNEVRFHHLDGRVVAMGKCARYRLVKGEVVEIVTGTGGGFGSALARDPQRVRDDVVDGYVSLESAERDYGVVLDPETLEIVELCR